MRISHALQCSIMHQGLDSVSMIAAPENTQLAGGHTSTERRVSVKTPEIEVE